MDHTNGNGKWPTEYSHYLGTEAMNFLGHLYLSGNDPLVIVGNFMGDAVKGSDLSAFDPAIERGLRLHRAIDSFTDSHPLQKQGKERAREFAGRYAPVVMDLYYDHVLASNWSEFHDEPLSVFSQRMYRLLDQHRSLMPERTQHMLRYMIEGDKLTSYATLPGIGRALAGLARRVPHGAAMAGSEIILQEHLALYTAEFRIFLIDINAHVAPLR